MRHLAALASALDGVSEEDYVAALRDGDPDAIIQKVYPLERAVEVVSNYTVALAIRGLRLVGVTATSGADALRRLRDQGVISHDMCRKLVAANRVRNAAQHEYEGVRGSVLYAVAREQEQLTQPFLSAYVRWLRSLGYMKRD